MKKVTIHDIAKELNITFSTVARALNDHPAISVATKEAVREVAQRLNYTQNKLASSLRSGYTKVIGVIVPTIEVSFFSTVVHGIENILNMSGYSILLYQTKESFKNEKKGIETFLQLRVDGIIASLSLETTHYEHFAEIRNRNIPLLLFDRTIEEIDVPYVRIDDYKGGYIAAEHLIKQGYKNIAIISTDRKIDIFKERLRGSLDALKNYGLHVDENMIFYGSPSIEFGRNCIQELNQRGIKYDGIVALEDYTALGAIQAMKSYGTKVPQEVGVIGFANEAFGAYITPKLTTIDQQNVKMGEESAKLFLKLIKNKDYYSSTSEKVILDPILIPRESSVNPNW